MKKNLTIIILIALFLLPLKVNASTASASLSCPTKASAGQVINCSINTSNSGDINGITAKFAFSGGASYSNFSFAGGYQLSLQNYSNQGFQMGVNGTLSANGTIATLSVKIPDGAAAGSQHTISLTNVQASNTAYEDVVGYGNSQTVTVVSSNNYLSSLSITGANINFNKSTSTYTVKINAASATINAKAEDGSASVSGTGTVSLKVGKNSFNIIVTAQSGAKRTYTIVVNRPKQNTGATQQPQQPQQPTNPTPEPEPEQPAEDIPLPEVPGSDGLNAIEGPDNGDKDSNNKLKSLNADKVKIPFNKAILEYDLYVGYDVNEIKITATSESKKAEISGNKQHKLIVGRNIIRIAVKAENGDVRVYELTIHRDEKEKVTKANKLEDITIDGVEINFDKDKNEYKILTSQKSLDINVTLSNDNSSYSIKGNHNLVDGSEIRIKVTDKDDNLNVYTIKINMPPNGKRASKKCNLGLAILLCIIFFLLGGGAGFGTYYYLEKVRTHDEDPEDGIPPTLEGFEREDETAPDILSMTAEIKPVGEPVKKTSDL